MSRKQVVAFGSLALLSVTGVALGGIGAYFGFMNQPESVSEVVLADAALEGDVLSLKSSLAGGNTMVSWACSKSGMDHDYTGAWNNIHGAIALEGTVVQAIELQIATDSMVSWGAEHPAPGALVEAVEGWFDASDPAYEMARFVSSSIVRKDAVEAEVAADAVEGWTHLLVGEFSLHGHTKKLAIPVRLNVSESAVNLLAHFTVLRSDFTIEGLGADIVDDEVALQVSIESARDISTQLLTVNTRQSQEILALQNELHALTEAQQATSQMLSQVSGQLSQMQATLAGFEGGARAPIDVSQLPVAFSDQAVGQVAGTVVGFDMVLVYDESSGIAPFYAQTTEVSWDLFNIWLQGQDISEAPVYGPKFPDVPIEGIRPSKPYIDYMFMGLLQQYAETGRDVGQLPVMALRHRSATEFCKWLSEQTGRHYRLPTEREWQLMLELGGGVPGDLANAGRFLGNSMDDQMNIEMPAPINDAMPNGLGLYHLLGNVSEWVNCADGRAVLRGGSYMQDARDGLLHDDVYVQDNGGPLPIEAWYATFQSHWSDQNGSFWWAAPESHQGFRLICEPVNLPNSEP